MENPGFVFILYTLLAAASLVAVTEAMNKAFEPLLRKPETRDASGNE